jgi:hypothetical protein
METKSPHNMESAVHIFAFKTHLCAHKIQTVLNSHILQVIAGNGHFMYYCGIPERVLEQHPELAQKTCLIVSQSVEAEDLEQEESI